MEMSFFALPSQQGPVLGRFKLTHLPISLNTKVAACVRRFETPTPLNYGRTEAKKDIPMLGLRSISKSQSVTYYLFSILYSAQGHRINSDTEPGQ